jgi:hypothetical protein
MLILFETPAGFALFKANDKKLAKVDNVFEEFATAEKAQNLCVAAGCRMETGGGRRAPPGMQKLLDISSQERLWAARSPR